MFVPEAFVPEALGVVDVKNLILSVLIIAVCQPLTALTVDERPGNLKSPISEIKFKSTHEVVPICNDGSLVNIQEFTLTTSANESLTGVTLTTDGTTDLADLAEIGIVHLRKSGDRKWATSLEIEPTIKLKGQLDLPPGDHRFRITLRTKKGANLLHRIGVQIAAIHFANGSTYVPGPLDGAHPQRLAYPIHHQNQFECHTFRIPGVARANNRDLLAVFDMRYHSRRDLQEHIDIGLSRSSDGGQTWSDPVPIMDMGEYGGKPQKENGCSDPGILVDTQTGEIFVAACWTHGKPNTHQWRGTGSAPGLDLKQSTQFMVVRSQDNGKSWSPPENWTNALKDPAWYLFAPAPGNGITLSNGTLVLPTQGRDAQGLPFSNITWSDDHGKTWNVSSHARDDTTECAVAELSNGHLILNMRDNRNRQLKGSDNGRAVATTVDLGATWVRHASDHSLLPEPTCMASLISFKRDSDPILLFSNPRHRTQRKGMTLQMSIDNGVTWPDKNQILLDSRGGAYSSLVMIDDQTIGIVYESSVADMIFQRIPLSDLMDQGIDQGHPQQSQDDPSTEFLHSLRPDHPRLLFTNEMEQSLRKTARTDSLLQRLIQQNIVNAEAMLTGETIRYHIPDGKRLLAQSRKCIERVTTLAMAYRWTDDKRFADAAIREMLIAARFKDWNPSHFLDTAEMTTALAIGYDWLFDVIEPDDRKEIRESIVRLGLTAGMKVYEKGGWWTTRDNNWNQVCNGGLLMGALAIAEDEPKLAAQIMDHARKSIPYALRPYAPDGAYPEGPAYWQYGTTYTCLTIQALSTALGTDWGISSSPGMNLTGNFRMHTIGPNGLYFNYADASSKSRLGSSIWILARIYDNSTFRRWHVQRLQNGITADINEMKPKRIDRFFPLEIAFYDPAGGSSPEPTPPLDALFRGSQDVVTLRESWNDPDAAYVGFKGGDNRANHGHLDIGTFVFDSGGVRWAIDLGSDNYNLPGYFGNKRWTYYRLTNRSHNTLVINDRLQNKKAVGRVIAFGSGKRRAAAVVDMTDAYAGQVESAKRGIELVDRKALHVRDEISNPVGEVRWGMVTQAQIAIEGPQATLVQNGKTLVVELRSPANGTFEVVSTTPPTSAEKPNKRTRMLAVRVPSEPGKPIIIDVVMQLKDGTPVTPESFSPTLASWPAKPTADKNNERGKSN